MQSVEIAWAAGFLDGEGCFWVRVSHSEPRIQVRGGLDANQVDPRPLEKLCALFGGSIHPVTDRGPGRRQPSWRWQIRGYQDLRRVIPLLLPYLVLKREQAEVLLEYAELPRKPQWEALSGDDVAVRTALAERIATLKVEIAPRAA